MIKKVLTIFFITSLPFLLFTQNSGIDSAREALLAHQQDDTAKVNRLNALSWEFNRTDLDSTAYYANKAKDLAREIDYPSGYGRALNLLGIVAIYNENSALCDSLNKQALLIAEAINDSLLLSQCLNDLAVNYVESGEIAKALEYYQNALRYTLSSDLLGQVYTLSNISSLYLDDNKPEQAEKYLTLALEVAQKSKDPLTI